MKVERKEEFTPVTITLESQDELNYLWHCLDSEKIEKIVTQNAKDIFPFNSGVGCGMWESLNKIMNE